MSSILIQIIFCLSILFVPKTLADTIEPKIINGEQASLGQFPWQVIIGFTGDSGQWICGGTLISDEWIITAAHCSLGYIMSFVYAGLVDLSNESTSPYRFVLDFIHHENFSQYTLANDIAVLRVEQPFEFTDNIQAIDVASYPLEPNVEFVVSGWGQTNDDGGTTDILNYVTLTTIDNKDCDQIYGTGTILDEMICATSGTEGTEATCFGDTGGPAVIYEDENPVLVAVASFISDRGCKSTDPSGFIRVDQYREWIQEKTGIIVKL